MMEGAEEILEHLPIRRSESEDKYIEHLWESFLQLQSGNESSRAFSVLPYHLIFMLALQYKALRVYLQRKERYQDAFVLKYLPEKSKRASAPASPFDLATLRETEVVDVLRIAGLSIEDAKKIKSVINYRNGIAHAAGNIESNREAKIIDCLQCLRIAQLGCLGLNRDAGSVWASEVQEDHIMDEFFEARFFESRVSPRDFGDILPFVLRSKNLTDEQWKKIIDKGLSYSPDQTLAILREVSASPKTREELRILASHALEENGIEAN